MMIEYSEMSGPILPEESHSIQVADLTTRMVGQMGYKHLPSMVILFLKIEIIINILI